MEISLQTKTNNGADTKTNTSADTKQPPMGRGDLAKANSIKNTPVGFLVNKETGEAIYSLTEEMDVIEVSTSMNENHKNGENNKNSSESMQPPASRMA